MELVKSELRLGTCYITRLNCSECLKCQLFMRTSTYKGVILNVNISRRRHVWFHIFNREKEKPGRENYFEPRLNERTGYRHFSSVRNYFDESISYNNNNKIVYLLFVTFVCSSCPH